LHGLICAILFSVAKTASTIAVGALPVAALSGPAMAMVLDSMPTQSLALEVQFGGFLAVILGTLLPCLFLINLFIQTESRKAGRSGGLDAE
jgi:photosystem II PsbM protein